MKKLNITIIVLFLLPLVVGGIAGFATASSVSTWYVGLEKPFFNPPNWVFGPVWTILYSLMGISSILIYRSPISAERRISLDVYFLQLFLNFTWSFLFFGLKSPLLALINIILLLIMIMVMIIQFSRVNKIAAGLQIAYLLWVSFATALNLSIWYLN
jgi:benzodiazapine receptor